MLLLYLSIIDERKVWFSELSNLVEYRAPPRVTGHLGKLQKKKLKIEVWSEDGIIGRK